MQVISFSDVIASDKFAYLPSIGLLMVLASLLCWFCDIERLGKTGMRRAIAIIIVLILAGAEAVGTRRHLVYWRDTTSLFEYMLTAEPDAASVHNTLGWISFSEGKVDKAVEHFYQALQSNSNYAGAHYNLANVLTNQGRLDDAIKHYYYALENASVWSGKIHNNLANALKLQGKLDEAIKHYRQALKLSPKPSDVYFNLAHVFISQEKFDEAISCLRQGLLASPNWPVMHYKLAYMLEKTGQVEEALKHYRESLRLKPNYVEPLNKISKILAIYPDPRLRNTTEAMIFAQRAAELTKYKDASVLETLSVAYAATGRFDQAIAIAETAVELALENQNDKLAERIRKQLQFYKQRPQLPKP
jgi:tetratricopeptide (TPR) repeat protein